LVHVWLPPGLGQRLVEASHRVHGRSCVCVCVLLVVCRSLVVLPGPEESLPRLRAAVVAVVQGRGGAGAGFERRRGLDKRSESAIHPPCVRLEPS
jgi:hypothetical protein